MITIRKPKPKFGPLCEPKPVLDTLDRLKVALIPQVHNALFVRLKHVCLTLPSLREVHFSNQAVSFRYQGLECKAFLSEPDLGFISGPRHRPTVCSVDGAYLLSIGRGPVFKRKDSINEVLSFRFSMLGRNAARLPNEVMMDLKASVKGLLEVYHERITIAAKAKH